MIDVGNLTVFALVLMRMSGCIFFNPIIGRRNFPAIFKVGLTVLLSIVVVSFAKITPPDIGTPVEFIICLLKEFLVGYVIGFIITLFSFVISFGGEVIDMQMGMSMSKVYDPQSNVSMSLSATFYNILYMFLFFAAYGHITLIRLFIISGEIVPFGQASFRPELSTAIIDLFCQCTVLAVKLALPIIAIEIIIEIGVGILMKAIPQINVFVINIQAKLLIGLIMMLVLFAPFSNFLERLVTLLFDTIENVVRLI